MSSESPKKRLGQPDPSLTAGSLSTDGLFAEFFGLSRDELRSKGVAPDAYAKKHFDAIIKKDEGKAELLGIPRSKVILSRSFRWGRRFYTCIFVGMGFLVGAALGHSVVLLRALFLALAAISLVGGFLMLQRQFASYRQYRDSCREEGIRPQTLWGRPMPAWRIKHLKM